eukprot:COSAG02_NODE_2994_length_7586_cov_3.858822_1_plen_102_part_00
MNLPDPVSGSGGATSTAANGTEARERTTSVFATASGARHAQTKQQGGLDGRHSDLPRRSVCAVRTCFLLVSHLRQGGSSGTSRRGVTGTAAPCLLYSGESS